MKKTAVLTGLCALLLGAPAYADFNQTYNFNGTVPGCGSTCAVTGTATFSQTGSGPLSITLANTTNPVNTTGNSLVGFLFTLNSGVNLSGPTVAGTSIAQSTVDNTKNAYDCGPDNGNATFCNLVSITPSTTASATTLMIGSNGLNGQDARNGWGLGQSGANYRLGTGYDGTGTLGSLTDFSLGAAQNTIVNDNITPADGLGNHTPHPLATTFVLAANAPITSVTGMTLLFNTDGFGVPPTVPEPGFYGALALGISALAIGIRRKKAA